MARKDVEIIDEAHPAVARVIYRDKPRTAATTVWVNRPHTGNIEYSSSVGAHRNHVAHVLGLVEFPGVEWYVAQRGTVVYFRVEMNLPNNIEGGEPELQRGRPWVVRPGADDGEIVRSAWLAIETFLIHEAREQFKYDGKRVMYPHFEV